MNTTKPFTLYVNPSWRREGAHTPLMNPWWGNPLSEASLFTKQAFDTYLLNTPYYSLSTDLESADMVLVPYPHMWCIRHDMHLLHECIETAAKAGLPLLVDGTGDVEYPVPADNAYVLRYGGYRFIKDPRRIQIPLFTDDLLARCRNGQFLPRQKGNAKPVIGFAGWASLSLKQYIKTFIKEIPLRLRGLTDARYRACTKGVLWRQRAIQILKRSPLVTFRGQARSTFSGSVKTVVGTLGEVQQQMVDTILESDYALDVKGDANNSARLYEILSLGRIPVIVDTERNFPFRDKIDYASFALIVDFRDIKKLPQRIADFHNALSPERFVEMQRNAREAYVQYFRPDAVMWHIVDELKEKLSKKTAFSEAKDGRPET